MAKRKKKSRGRAAATAATSTANAASGVAKEIHFTAVAWKFYGEQSAEVREAFDARVAELATNGKLEMPHGKAIAPNLFEIRVKVDPNQYRLFYCYAKADGIWVLSGFVKKTQKTPRREINKAKHIRAEVLK